MLTLNPIRKALVPVDSAAAKQLVSPNYDEFQGDHEIVEVLKSRPNCVLRVTMPHCNLDSTGELLEEGSAQALSRAQEEMSSLLASKLTRVVKNVLWVHEVTDDSRPGVRQIGLGGMAEIEEIRTPSTPQGTIIRNEGIREKKAQGRADLIKATKAIIGTVINTIDDQQGAVSLALESFADRRPCDFEATIETGNTHRVWLIEDPEDCARFSSLMAAEPYAYVADGNHRSAAAAMLGQGEFLAVFFPARTMGLASYNRLLKAPGMSPSELEQALGKYFMLEKLTATEIYQPQQIHSIGLYTQGTCYRLTPKENAYDMNNAAQSIDADIVQRRIFSEIFGISDPADARLTFVGGNRDARYLKERVDEGSFDYAITLAPITIEQFIEVCRNNLLMPPKSSWFQPKLRCGLVMAVLE